MKYVKTGNGELPLISLIAMLAVSLTLNLPGLAISPLLGKLKDVFPDSSQLQVQLLTVLPNLVIIPFVLFSGKLVSKKTELPILAVGLAIFLASGIGYFFADSMNTLIVLSCILGVGCGLVVPIAAGLIAEHFYGDDKRRILGFESGIQNGIVILATLFVGWAATYGWHKAFAVYLIPVLPLVLLPFMSRGYMSRHFKAVSASGNTAAAAGGAEPSSTMTTSARRHNLWALIGLYTIVSFSAIVFTYYLPFTMKDYGFSTGSVGVANSMFFLSAMIGGFSLAPFIKWFGKRSMFIGLGIMLCGLVCLAAFHVLASYVGGVFLIGLGYGVFQPVIYNKTSDIAPTKEASTRYFSYIMASDYVAIAIVPFVIEGARWLFHSKASAFPYWFDVGVMVVVIVIGLLFRDRFPWKVRDHENPTD